MSRDRKRGPKQRYQGQYRNAEEDTHESVLRITKLAVRNELSAPDIHFGLACRRVWFLPQLPVPTQLGMRDTSSERSALTTPLRPGIASRTTQNEAHRQTARTRRGREGPHLSVASPRGHHRDRQPWRSLWPMASSSDITGSLLSPTSAKRQRCSSSRCSSLQKENDRLHEHINHLQSDPDAIEHEAREELHYTRAGEVIYTLPSASSDPSKSSPAPNPATK